MTAVLAVLSGSLVGFVLGLIGGGGSIIAVPLLLYVVGIGDPHAAIGTAALAVSVNAMSCFAQHWRAGNVHWRTAAVFAAAGVPGALVGSTLGKAFDGHRLLFLFAIVMVVVALSMLRTGEPTATVKRDAANVAPTRPIGARVVAVAFCVGTLSGFFGIGGGFLIVPGLLLATGMPLLDAIGTSLFAVAIFGVTTAANYMISGLIDWPVAFEYIVGGIVGGHLGMRLACSLAGYKGILKRLLATIVLCVAVYMLWETAGAWMPITRSGGA